MSYMHERSHPKDPRFEKEDVWDPWDHLDERVDDYKDKLINNEKNQNINLSIRNGHTRLSDS